MWFKFFFFSCWRVIKSLYCKTKSQKSGMNKINSCWGFRIQLLLALTALMCWWYDWVKKHDVSVKRKWKKSGRNKNLHKCFIYAFIFQQEVLFFSQNKTTIWYVFFTPSTFCYDTSIVYLRVDLVITFFIINFSKICSTLQKTSQNQSLLKLIYPFLLPVSVAASIFFT